MGANRGAIDAVMPAVRHDLGQRNRNGFPDPGLTPAPKPPVDGVPIPVFGWDVAPGCSTAKAPKYAVDDRTVLLGTPTTAPVYGINRQQCSQNTPFCFGEIAPAQACLQKAVLNQPSLAASTNSSTPPKRPLPVWIKETPVARMSYRGFFLLVVPDLIRDRWPGTASLSATLPTL